MFNFKLSGIIGGVAFVFSFLLGLISRSAMPMLLIKPLVFAFLFFAVSILIKITANHFLPELMEESDLGEEPYRPGSTVDITDEDSLDYQADTSRGHSGESVTAAQGFSFMGARPDDSDDGLGDISDLARKSTFSPSLEGGYQMGMDQNAEEGYTEGGGSRGSQARAPGAGSTEAFSPEEVLPDLDSMAGVFMPSSSDEEPEGEERPSHGQARKPSSSSTPSWTEDFNAKEMAQGLRTVLSKEKEG